MRIQHRSDSMHSNAYDDVQRDTFLKASRGSAEEFDEWLQQDKRARNLARDARDAAFKSDSAYTSAVFDHFDQRNLQALLALWGLNLAVFLAWASKPTSHQRFMGRHFIQHLPPSGTAAYTLLTSAFSHPGPGGWVSLVLTLYALDGMGGRAAQAIMAWDLTSLWPATSPRLLLLPLLVSLVFLVECGITQIYRGIPLAKLLTEVSCT